VRNGQLSPDAMDAIAACSSLLARDVQPKFAYEVLTQKLAEASPTPAR
jgi:hypothetical protein